MIRTDAEVLAHVEQRWAEREQINARPGRRHIAVGVEPQEVAHGMRRQEITGRLARLEREGRLTRTFDDRAGDRGCYVYRPA
jgi:hypothetical protein